MIVFLPIGLILLFVGLWVYRRGSSLTALCRWRQSGQAAPGLRQWRCAACGAECQLPPGQEPRQCLRSPPAQQ